MTRPKRAQKPRAAPPERTPFLLDQLYAHGGATVLGDGPMPTSNPNSRGIDRFKVFTVLTFLAANANRRRQAWHGAGYIATHVGLHRARVHEALYALEHLGLIRRTGKKESRAVVYEVLPGLPDTPVVSAHADKIVTAHADTTNPDETPEVSAQVSAHLSAHADANGTEFPSSFLPSGRREEEEDDDDADKSARPALTAGARPTASISEDDIDIIEAALPWPATAIWDATDQRLADIWHALLDQGHARDTIATHLTSISEPTKNATGLLVAHLKQLTKINPAGVRRGGKINSTATTTSLSPGDDALLAQFTATAKIRADRLRQPLADAVTAGATITLNSTPTKDTLAVALDNGETLTWTAPNSKKAKQRGQVAATTSRKPIQAQLRAAGFALRTGAYRSRHHADATIEEFLAALTALRTVTPDEPPTPKRKPAKAPLSVVPDTTPLDAIAAWATATSHDPNDISQAVALFTDAHSTAVICYRDPALTVATHPYLDPDTGREDPFHVAVRWSAPSDTEQRPRLSVTRTRHNPAGRSDWWWDWMIEPPEWVTSNNGLTATVDNPTTAHLDQAIRCVGLATVNNRREEHA